MEPFEVKSRPTSSTVGKFSLPYSVASLLKDRKLVVDSYDDEKLMRSDVLSLSRQVTYERKAFSTADTALPGAVRISLKSGRSYYREVLNERGGPKCPLTNADIVDKFLSNLGAEIPEQLALVVADRIMSLPFAKSVVSESLLTVPQGGVLA